MTVVSSSETLDLAMRLWPSVRDGRGVDDPTDLDRLLATHGQPGAPGYDCGLRSTFAGFAPGEDATDFALATGERPAGDEDGRFIAHLAVTRVLVGAGLAIDARVSGAIAESYALSWTASGGGNYHQSALALAVSMWLPALDPDTASDRPLPLDWTAACFADEERWDPDYRLFSRYDIRERALDWAAYVSSDAARHRGVSVWTIVEPLLRLGHGGRANLALAQFAEATDSVEETPPAAAALLERNRIAGALRERLAQGGSASAR